MRILTILTSHDRLGETGDNTGFWLEELAAPYFVFQDAGAEVTLASPAGGQPPLDPKSDTADTRTEATRRFRADARARGALADTHKLSHVSIEDYDALFYPGGHGPLWDLAEDRHSIALIEAAAATGKPVAAVCHGPAALRNACDRRGQPLVKGLPVTAFTNSEEAAVGLTEVVPFSVEDMLKANGAQFHAAANWECHVVSAGALITGQNPASSAATAEALLRTLRGV